MSDPAIIGWLPSGAVGLQRLLALVRAARRSLRLEMYIYKSGPPGDALREALVAAAGRGVAVRVLIDAMGSPGLADDYWQPLRQAGGEVRWFHPLGSGRVLVRDHRKLCVTDDTHALVFGFNVAPEYDGDGVAQGWRDLGIELAGAPAAVLGQVFDRQFVATPALRLVVPRIRPRQEFVPPVPGAALQVLPMSPGRNKSCFARALSGDLAGARTVWFCTPYFLPDPGMRREIRRAARRGADVRLVLPGQADVPLAQRAARHLYAGLFRAGVGIWEYQPQVLHAKLLIAGEAVYVGSSNLDQRSLHLNYELMIRLTGPEVLAGGRALFADLLAHSTPVDRQTWRRSRNWLQKLREEWAYFILYRLDPWVTRKFSAGE